MKGSDLFIRCLEEEGVEYIFGLPGEENADLMISLMNSKKIRFILVRHEQAAAFMADVYGRLTQKVGICLSTLGPGATNLTTGVANANMDRSPILAITGQTHSELLHKESHQNMDVITMFKSITKWNWSIRNSDTIPEIVRRAFKTSLQQKTGATHIELAQDIAKHNSAIIPLEAFESLRARPNETLIIKAVKLILGSKKPLILVGNGCVRGNASPSLREFVRTTGIFSVNTFMAKGVISDTFASHLQTIGIKEADHVLIAVKKADLVITIGYDLVEYSPKHWNSDLKKTIIHIDFTPAEVDTYYSPTIEIAADIEYTIEAITRQLREQVENKVHSRIRKKRTYHNVRAYFERNYIWEPFKKIRKEIEWRSNEKFKNDLSFPIKPEKLVYDVRTALDKNDIVISDVGVHKLWIAKLYNTFSPNTCLIPNGFCSMGFALPGAIAAQLVKPDRKVVAMCGDGGFLMNVQEIETAVRLRMPIIIIVWCDCDFGMISLKQTEEFGKSGFTKFMNPNFVKLAESFGAIGYRVKSTEEFANVLKQAKTSTATPVIIAIDVDYSRNRLLLNDDFTALQVGHFAG